MTGAGVQGKITNSVVDEWYRSLPARLNNNRHLLKTNSFSQAMFTSLTSFQCPTFTFHSKKLVRAKDKHVSLHSFQWHPPYNLFSVATRQENPLSFSMQWKVVWQSSRWIWPTAEYVLCVTTDVQTKLHECIFLWHWMSLCRTVLSTSIHPVENTVYLSPW